MDLRSKTTNNGIASLTLPATRVYLVTSMKAMVPFLKSWATPAITTTVPRSSS